MGSDKFKLVNLTIESPFTLLSCKATPANIFVPPYAVERDMALTPLGGCQCDCNGSTEARTPASTHQAAPPEAVNFTSTKPLSAEELTGPISIEGNTSDIKQPALVHLHDRDRASEVFSNSCSLSCNHWYGRFV